MQITVQTVVNAPVERVWKCWTSPEHITQWNAASDDWHTPWAENDVRVGGELVFRMEAKDGSAGFDLRGEYEEVERNKLLVFALEDERKVRVVFTKEGDTKTKVVETFEAETTNPVELQRQGWQAILDNFKRYVENY